MFLFTSGVKSQIGNYCWNEAFTKVCYKFKKDNRFEFKDFMCVGITEGQGRFEIKENKIRFFYEPIDFFENQFTIKKIKENKDEIKINFLIKDYDTGKKIKGYRVSQEKRGLFEKEIIHHKNQINITPEEYPIFINVSYPKYSNYTFKITESGQYDVELFLNYGKEGDSYEMKEGIEEFTISEMTENRIVLKMEEYDYEMILILENK